MLTVGEDGRLLLGREYAGQKVLVEEIRRGVWRIKTGIFIPDDELWLHQPEVRATLDEASSGPNHSPPGDGPGRARGD